MDTIPPKKSFENIVELSRQEKAPEVHVRLTVRQSLEADAGTYDTSSLFSVLSDWATPARLSATVAATACLVTVSGLQFIKGLRIIEEALVAQTFIWL